MKEGISRSRQNRVLGGVAAGLAEYLSIDILVVRILFIASTFLSGIGLLLYLILWIVVPEDKIIDFTSTENINSSGDATNSDINFTMPQKKGNNNHVVLGIILILFGLFFLGIEVFSFLNFEDLLPILLVGFGIYLLWNSKNKRGSNEI